MSHGPRIDYSSCKSCKTCYDICPMDVFGWDTEKNLPFVLRPDECSYCVLCELDCAELAIDVEPPLWVRVEHLERRT
ncbi:MAG: ferredoxin family protein [Deltaproteobacteria bacterium]|nr:ferredoxin family protein [Deltaproteobacteria bacterium]MBW2063793.1 ferredoxin family protein [Deltaproteobacteria bacterium]